MTNAYIPMTPADRQAMLAAIGVSSADELFADVPATARAPDAAALPAPLSELELMQELRSMAAQNTAGGDVAFFRGGGVYRRYVPAVVSDILRRGEFLTSYTPYQAEASQGTLQVTFEFQTMVAMLTGMEVANAGMYDGASALAEACLMACRATGRHRLAIADTVNPRYARVVRTYAEPQGIAIDTVDPATPGVTPEHACLVLQTPDYYGRIALTDDGPSRLCKEAGALLVVNAEAMSLALFRPPGELGADIVVADGQSLGLSPSFGGPYVGLFATKQEHVRQMPGRIVGQTTDLDGRRAYVLTLQAREQHIRRERASSNICTSEQLLALAMTAYLSCLGPKGLQQVARLCYEKSHYAAKLIDNMRGWGLVYPDAPFHQEFVIRCPRPVYKVNALLRREGIVGGLDVSADGESRMLLCVTETNTRAEIERLADALADMAAAE